MGPTSLQGSAADANTKKIKRFFFLNRFLWRFSTRDAWTSLRRSGTSRSPRDILETSSRPRGLPGVSHILAAVGGQQRDVSQPSPSLQNIRVEGTAEILGGGGVSPWNTDKCNVPLLGLISSKTISLFLEFLQANR